jgi:hypothetical protein
MLSKFFIQTPTKVTKVPKYILLYFYFFLKEMKRENNPVMIRFNSFDKFIVFSFLLYLLLSSYLRVYIEKFDKKTAKVNIK